MSKVVTKEHIDNLIDTAEITVQTIHGKCTLVIVKLSNGFILSETSGSISEDNYSVSEGYKSCINKIVDQLWLLEGYCLQKKLAEDKGQF